MPSKSKLDANTAIRTLFDFALDFQSNPQEIAKVRSQFVAALEDAKTDGTIEDLLSDILGRFALPIPTLQAPELLPIESESEGEEVGPNETDFEIPPATSKTKKPKS